MKEQKINWERLFKKRDNISLFINLFLDPAKVPPTQYALEKNGYTKRSCKSVREKMDTFNNFNNQQKTREKENM